MKQAAADVQFSQRLFLPEEIVPSIKAAGAVDNHHRLMF